MSQHLSAPVSISKESRLRVLKAELAKKNSGTYHYGALIAANQVTYGREISRNLANRWRRMLLFQEDGCRWDEVSFSTAVLFSLLAKGRRGNASQGRCNKFGLTRLISAGEVCLKQNNFEQICFPAHWDPKERISGKVIRSRICSEFGPEFATRGLLYHAGVQMLNTQYTNNDYYRFVTQLLGTEIYEHKKITEQAGQASG